MELDEFVDYAETHIDNRDYDSICEGARVLGALANNRKFLVNAYNEDLVRYSRSELLGSYTPQSIRLSATERFIIRANIWIPLSGDAKRRPLEESLYSYQTAHDHNFDFLTVGYLGSGYRTQIYEYDRQGIEGYPGEAVDLRFLEDTKLPHGKVMAFEAARDIHTQLPPDEVSISINLLPLNPEKAARQQFFFDIERRCIEKFADDINNKRVSLVTMAGLLHDDNTIDILTDIAGRHSCARTRAAAYAALMEACGDADGQLADAIGRDPDQRLASKVETQRKEFQ
ncbi:transposase [Niveispirillum sp. SYP-B3756]|uniref:transposase n=1 Tax=Niveispirillum sp. SYP-B3756 TaxID=2662178 RepID=UPI001291A788|nr:transposase [Niveispirillum sp. SYP-B3756]MQP67539.1 transposase [Niveispirillum sp. SYP-B3756]